MLKSKFHALAVLPFVIAACATNEPAVVEELPEPWAAESVMVGGLSVVTLADVATAASIEADARASAADGFKGDNKGNACYQAPMFTGVSGETILETTTRRAEYWNYTVCGEAYEVPVVVEKDEMGNVTYVVGSGREA
ncbi:MAG: hypothetical protein AAFR65_04330 [Pseudomonadota bacterium]